nr:MAG TPA: hypothetical protein [Caudoviricetes sp.]
MSSGLPVKFSRISYNRLLVFRSSVSIWPRVFSIAPMSGSSSSSKISTYLGMFRL